MAGIGFRLQKILRENSYKSLIEGYFYSALISTGPWLLSILGLGLIATIAPWMVDQREAKLFRVVVVYAYIGSLILTGGVQMGTTRYIADRLYVGDMKAILPTYRWLGAWVIAVSGALSALLYAACGLEARSVAAGVVIFQSISLTWIAMTMLSAAKDYMSIVRIFALGYAAAVGGSYALGRAFGLAGMLWGFACGMALLAMLISVRIAREFPSDQTERDDAARHWRSMPMLLCIGLFYNCGIFVDKLVFWLGPWGETVYGGFLTSPRYDTCMFLSYVSIVPAMSLFLIRIETAFYKHYASFYSTITQGGTLADIEREQRDMVASLSLSMSRLLGLQGIVTVALLLLAPQACGWLGLRPDHVPLMRVGLLSAFVQVLLMILLVILLYFDWQRLVAGLVALFFAGNLGFSLATQALPERYQGFGYLLACLLPLGAGMLALEKRLDTLLYETFSRQQIRG